MQLVSRMDIIYKVETMWFRLRSVNKVFGLNLLIQWPFHVTRKLRRKWLKWTCISCLFTRDLPLILLLVSLALSPCNPLVKPPEPLHKSLTYFISPAPLREVWKSLDYGAGASKEIWDQVLTQSLVNRVTRKWSHMFSTLYYLYPLVYKYANYILRKYGIFSVCFTSGLVRDCS